MALIKCPECQSEVSDQALSCPKCGFPLKGEASLVSDVNKIVEEKIQTVQLTSKKWKKMKLIFVPMFILGLFVFPSNLLALLFRSEEPSRAGLVLGGLFFFVGFIGTLVAFFGAWWNNR